MRFGLVLLNSRAQVDTVESDVLFQLSPPSEVLYTPRSESILPFMEAYATKGVRLSMTILGTSSKPTPDIPDFTILHVPPKSVLFEIVPRPVPAYKMFKLSGRTARAQSSDPVIPIRDHIPPRSKLR